MFCLLVYFQFECELKNREQEIRDLKIDLRILQRKFKTSEETINSLRVRNIFNVNLKYYII